MLYCCRQVVEGTFVNFFGCSSSKSSFLLCCTSTGMLYFVFISFRSLLPLYEDYVVSRERYYYYKDRLERVLYPYRRDGGPLPPPLPPPAQSRMTTMSEAEFFAAAAVNSQAYLRAAASFPATAAVPTADSYATYSPYSAPWPNVAAVRAFDRT
ncbi:hypothetical protein D918_05140 [Trichuris suis]|nr:hypothetical protein D918_05140 [Trichuris suis]